MSDISTDTRQLGDTFDTLATVVQLRYDRMMAAHGSHLFETNAADLYQTYLACLPLSERQHHTCTCCRHFIERYGHLAFVNAEGDLVPAMWPEIGAPEPYTEAVVCMNKAVRRSSVTGIFVSSELRLGVSEAGGFTHFCVVPQHIAIWVGYDNPNKIRALHRENYRTLSHGLAEYPVDVVRQAVTLLKSEALYRSEKVLGAAKFLLELHTTREQAQGKRKSNLTWQAVARAAPGWCTPRSGMVGTLLDDLQSGMSSEDAGRRFAAKMNPLQYMRPTAAPSEGSIAVAEKLFAEMKLAPALGRKFLRQDEIPASGIIWREADARAKEFFQDSGATQDKDGVFQHLRKSSKKIDSPEAVAPPITFVKFQRDVLTDARRIEVRISGVMNMCALVTATDPDAPPILQWDDPKTRNPVSWYVYSGGSVPNSWGLTNNTWYEVPMIVLQPSMWGSGLFDHHGKSAIFVVPEARDKQNRNLAIFPETLRSELHGVRKVIEAHSRSGIVAGAEAGDANGVRVGDSGNLGRASIRVTDVHGGRTIYNIDRWE